MGSRIVALAIHRRIEEARSMAKDLLLQESWAWRHIDGTDASGIPEQAFFELSGRTPTDLLYTMDQILSAHLDPLRPFKGSSDPKFIFDFGVQGGGDLNYFIYQKKSMVLGVDADVQRLETLRHRLVSNRSRRFRLLHAAVVGPEWYREV